jgi:hypothetical protein
MNGPDYHFNFHSKSSSVEMSDDSLAFSAVGSSQAYPPPYEQHQISADDFPDHTDVSRPNEAMSNDENIISFSVPSPCDDLEMIMNYGDDMNLVNRASDGNIATTSMSVSGGTSLCKSDLVEVGWRSPAADGESFLSSGLADVLWRPWALLEQEEMVEISSRASTCHSSPEGVAPQAHGLDVPFLDLAASALNLDGGMDGVGDGLLAGLLGDDAD